MVCAAVTTRAALWWGMALALGNIAYSVVKIVYVTPVVMSISTCAVSTLLVVCAAMHVAFSVAELFIMGAIMRTQDSLHRSEDSLPLVSADGMRASPMRGAARRIAVCVCAHRSRFSCGAARRPLSRVQWHG